jgi:flagellar biosynthesis chaperone FliJ
VAVSRALRRLLRIRELEEEQCRLALESAISELNRLEHAMVATADRDRRGRRLVETSAHTGELRDRLAGLEETRAANRMVEVLAPRIERWEAETGRLREAFLEKRVERRQAETLISETEARDAIESGRRGQQVLDDWFRSRQHRARMIPERVEQDFVVHEHQINEIDAIET